MTPEEEIEEALQEAWWGFNGRKGCLSASMYGETFTVVGIANKKEGLALLRHRLEKAAGLNSCKFNPCRCTLDS